MKRLAMALSATVLATGTALAGGIDRSGQPIGAIFEPGNYLEMSFAMVNPTVDAVGSPLPSPTPGAASGDMAPRYGQFAAAFKMPVTDNLDAALILDQPFGANVAYPISAYFASGATAQLSSTAVTGILKYRFADRFSVYAGLRQQSMKASAMVPFVAGYAATGANDYGYGYLVGAAYERPDIHLRVALTYNSTVEHSLATTETSVLAPLGITSTTTFDTPQSVNLDFQSGIAPKTLLFGGIRWVEWSKFAITPIHYSGLTGRSLVSYADDRFTYTLGLGRQINANWAVAGTASYEPQTGSMASNLSPTDGKTSVGLGVTYRQGNMKLQAGVSQIWIGDAKTAAGPFNGGTFTGNSATAFGMKIGFNF